MSDDLIQAIADLKEKEALRITKQSLDRGEDPLTILENARNALEIVGKLFESCEYFIPDLVYSGEILKHITDVVKPRLSSSVRIKRRGKFIIGTVAGDIHDIGKDIVAFMFDISGFEVYDLGIDVPSQKFVEKIKETKAEIVGLSGFLTLAFESMKRVVDDIKSAGLRDRVQIIIGGGQMNDDVSKYVGADAYRADALSGVSLAKEWLRGR